MLITITYHYLNGIKFIILNIHECPRLSIREIAKRLNRSHTTISRELKRNSGCWCDQYYPNPAQFDANKRLSDRAKRIALNIKNRENITLDLILIKALLKLAPFYLHQD